MQNGVSTFHIHPAFSSSSSSSSSQSSPCHSHTPPDLPPSFSTSTSQQQQQQQQQHSIKPTIDTTTAPQPVPHVALMQYSIPGTSTANLPQGYLAVPYSSLQDIQLRMQQPMLPPHMQLGTGMAAPVMTMASDSVIGLAPAGVQMMGGPVQQAQLAQYAMAHGGSNPNAALMQGPGSWVTPVPVMNSCVMNNPFQPGAMATPWVK